MLKTILPSLPRAVISKFLEYDEILATWDYAHHLDTETFSPFSSTQTLLLVTVL